MARRDAFLVAVDGHRTAIGDLLLIGRAHEVELRIQSGRVARHHVRLLRLASDDVEAEDLGTTNGTLVNEQPLRAQVLKAGDVLEVDGHRFRFELGPAPEPVEDLVAARLAQASDDPVAVQVVIDALLEEGNPVGTQLAERVPVPLEPVLEAAVRAGDLQLERWHGFIRSARFRPQSFEAVRGQLLALARSEASRFLVELALPEFSPRFGLEGLSLPMLRTLRFGPFFLRGAATASVAAVEGLQFPGLPKLVTPPPVEFFGKAWLDFGAEQRRELSPGRQESFPACAVAFDRGQWVVRRGERAHPLWVNGISRYDTALLPDDVVRSGNVQFTFRAN